MRQYFNWKTYLILAALCIVGASLYYTSQLASKLAAEERKKMEQVVDAIKIMADEESGGHDLTFASTFVSQNTTIPFIAVDEEGNTTQYNNLDTAKVSRDTTYLRTQLKAFMSTGEPIVAEMGYGLGKQYIYYGESYLLTQLRYFPYVQLAIIMLFLVVVLISFSTAHRSIQNQVWVGLSKETAHQLGTPLSSIEGWLELLKEDGRNAETVAEMQKDLDRLKLVADRFGKVGSVPVLEEEDVRHRLRNMVDYMQKRAPAKVHITIDDMDKEIPVNLSGPLFDWVVENLMRNALDAMEGKGNIHVSVQDTGQQVWIDIADTGKGIPRHQVKKIFNPGFTTKKRGWGLGLSLSKRIIKKYHHGSLIVKNTEAGKGTTFRIILRR
jgi:nitrogen-specific signal transduction histidine kinase